MASGQGLHEVGGRVVAKVAAHVPDPQPAVGGQRGGESKEKQGRCNEGFNAEPIVFAFCILHFAFCILLFAFCFLLFAFCFFLLL